MAFGFYNPQKEGTGVEKKEYTPRFNLYCELVFRKSWLMAKSNFIYLLTNIIAVMFFWAGFKFVSQGILSTLKGAVFLTAATLYLTAVGIGFIMPGLTFLSRYFARQRHVWVFSDFYGQIYENFKKGAIIFVIDTALIYLSSVAISLYGELALTNKFMLIPLGFITVCLLIYFMMHYYIYQIMVTFELDLKNILKNSLLLTLAHLPKNLLITFIITIIPLALYIINIPITAIFMAIIGVAFLNFTINFMVDPIIDKHLYIPAETIAENQADNTVN